ncbi:MAG: dockerin type I repeat-containing protein, partial [Planctomycetota bacterium]|nr:dockerin type I repeat-containing protein [Planctomycetota bacterium]
YTWVYLQSNNLHSVAATTMSALNAAAATHGDQWSRWNQQVYSVFGDPEMRVYNRAPFQLRLLLESFQIFQPELPIDILVFGDGNQVIPEAIVTLSGPQGPIFTGMSGADGRLQIPAGLDVGDAQELTLRAWVDDRNGMDAVQTIAVDQGSNSAAAEDLNGDGAIDGADLALLLASWGQPGDADFDGNGAVDGADLARLLGAWD